MGVSLVGGGDWDLVTGGSPRELPIGSTDTLWLLSFEITSPARAFLGGCTGGSPRRVLSALYSFKWALILCVLNDEWCE